MTELTAFTLGDLLSEESLGLRLVTGGDESLRRPVCGAHSIELEHPARWLDRDWVMLTTGLLIAPDQEHDGLIAELDEAGIAALGFGLDVVHASVPPGLLEEAGRRGFPVFSVPLPTAFRDIVSVVHRNLVSEEIRAFGRMSAMQRFLMDAIGEEDPKATIIERLASLIKARVGLLMPTGEFEIATAPLPGHAILAALGSRSALSFSLTLEGLHGHAFPVGGPGGTELPWLVIAGPEQQPLHPLAKAAGNATLPLLAAMSRLDQAQRMQEEAARRATLDALLEADGREESRVLAAQAAVWGLDLGQGVAIVVAEEAPGEGAGDPERLLARIESSRAKTKDSFLATVRDGKVCALLPAPVTDGRVTSTVLSAATGLRAGVGRVVTEPTGVLKSFSDAELALEARSEGSAARISRYDDLDLGTVLVRELPLARLAPKIEQWLEPLLDNPRVYETLVAYFKHNLDVGRTAQALHLHPNSVRYRLSRAEAIIGAPVRSPTTMIAVHVAMMSDIAPSDGFNGV